MTDKQQKAKGDKRQGRELKAQCSKPQTKQPEAKKPELDATDCNSVGAERTTPRRKLRKGNAKRKRAKTRGDEAKSKFADLIAKHVKNHKLEEPDRVILRRMLGHGPLDNALLASDGELRRVAGVFLGEALVKLKRASPDLYFHFWTFISDRGNTSDRQPVVDLKGMHSLVDQVFRKRKLPSISVAELQGLGNYPRKGNGRTIMNGIHAITWSDQRLDCKAIMSSFNESAVWSCKLGANPVDVRPIEDTEEDLHYMAYYMFKSPYDVKMVQTRTEGIRLKGTEKGYKPEFAARILEGLSQLEMSMLVRSTHDGKMLRADLQRRLTYWHKSRPEWSNQKLPQVDLEEFWRRIRSKKRKVEYGPYRFIR